MKAKINVGFNAKVQALSYNPVESTDSIEIEVEYEDDDDLEKKIEHYQKIIRNRTIKNVMKGAEQLIRDRAEAFDTDD